MASEKGILVALPFFLLLTSLVLYTVFVILIPLGTWARESNLPDGVSRGFCNITRISELSCNYLVASFCGGGNFVEGYFIPEPDKDSWDELMRVDLRFWYLKQIFENGEVMDILSETEIVRKFMQFIPGTHFKDFQPDTRYTGSGTLEYSLCHQFMVNAKLDDVADSCNLHAQLLFLSRTFVFDYLSPKQQSLDNFIIGNKSDWTNHENETFYRLCLYNTKENIAYAKQYNNPYPLSWEMSIGIFIIGFLWFVSMGPVKRRGDQPLRRLVTPMWNLFYNFFFLFHAAFIYLAFCCFGGGTEDEDNGSFVRTSYDRGSICFAFVQCYQAIEVNSLPDRYHSIPRTELEQPEDGAAEVDEEQEYRQTSASYRQDSNNQQPSSSSVLEYGISFHGTQEPVAITEEPGAPPPLYDGEGGHEAPPPSFDDVITGNYLTSGL